MIAIPEEMERDTGNQFLLTLRGGTVMKRNLLELLSLVLLIGLIGLSLALAAGEKSVTGTLLQTENSFVISADTGEIYDVEGQDLSAKVGKKVKATGTIEEGAEGKVLIAANIEEIRE
jgi:hypothetical protein